MPVRPKKSIVALASAVPRPDNQPRPTLSTDQPPHPSSAPTVAHSSPTPRRVNRAQMPVSLVMRNTRKSRNTSFYKPIPRCNHYLLARSLVQNDRAPKPLPPRQQPREHHNISPSPLCRDAFSPDSIIPDFIWRFSAPYIDSKTRNALAALKASDPETFKELVAGLD